MLTLAERIKALRQAAGKSQTELAANAGITLSVLTKLEQGVVSDPRLSTLRALAAALGVKVGDLVD